MTPTTTHSSAITRAALQSPHTRSCLEPALDFVGEMLRATNDAGHELSPDVHGQVRDLGMGKALEEIRGSYSHHMLLCIFGVTVRGKRICHQAVYTQAIV